MSSHHTKSKLRNSSSFGQLRLAVGLIVWPPRSRWAKRFVYGFAVTLTLVILGMYGIAQWYIHTEAGKPLQLGVSFIPDYAQSLGVDPQQTMNALIDNGVKQFRLVSYWSDGEPTKGAYDFSQLDWEFKTAEAHRATVILTLGLRQPRWPECHMPDWAINEAPTTRQSQLQQYMKAVINRYKDSPSLESYQLENEFFLKGFGNCDSIPGAEDRSRLVAEYQLVKQLDSKHPIIIGRSNNSLGWPIGKPQPDLFSVSIYKRVWDANGSRRYLEYPQPGWFYGFLAGWQKIFNHRDMIIGELQGEAWPPRGQDIKNISLAEQNKSMSAERLQDRISYGKATGMKQIELWGAEYWYYREVVLHDPSLMNVAKQEFNK